MGTKKQKTTATAEPWAPAQPYLQDNMRMAQTLYRQGPNTVAPFSPYTLQGMDLAAEQAKQGVNPIVGQAGGALGDTLSGNYLSGNPYLETQLSRASDNVSQRVNALFSGAGRYGSGAHQGVLGDSLASLEGDMRYRNYENERQNMLRAAQLAPQFAAQQQQLGMFGPQTLMNLGALTEDKETQYRREPYDMLNWYNQIIHGTGGLGGTQTQIQPGQSRMAGAMGGAMSGASAGSAAGPYGAIAGGILGGIAGYF